MLAKISLANLLRNRRRTVSTLFSIVFGVSIMMFANGYSDGFASQWGRSLVDEMQGHLVVRHKDYERYERTDLEQIFIENAQHIISELKTLPHVVEAIPRVITGGLISHGENSTIFVSWFNGLTELDATLPGHANSLLRGKPLSVDDPDGVVLGEKLAASIGADIGSELVLITNSIYGDRNAALVHVRGIRSFSTNADIESSFMVAGLSDQIRYDLLEVEEGATEIVIRLDSDEALDETVKSLNEKFAQGNVPWRAIPWHAEEAYQIITSMYKGMGIIVMIILSLLVGFVVSNAMTISLYERTRELGTMRAVGLKRSRVFLMSLYEFFMVMLVGSALGMLIGALFIWIGGKTGVTVSESVQVVRPVVTFENLIVSFLVPLLLSGAIVVFAIRAGNRMNITDMLDNRR